PELLGATGLAHGEVVEELAQRFGRGLLVLGEVQALDREDHAVGMHAEPTAKLVGDVFHQAAPAGRNHLRELASSGVVETHASPLMRTCFLSRRIPTIRSRSAASQSSRSFEPRMNTEGASE